MYNIYCTKKVTVSIYKDTSLGYLHGKFMLGDTEYNPKHINGFEVIQNYKLDNSGFNIVKKYISVGKWIDVVLQHKDISNQFIVRLNFDFSRMCMDDYNNIENCMLSEIIDIDSKQSIKNVLTPVNYKELGSKQYTIRTDIDSKVSLLEESVINKLAADDNLLPGFRYGKEGGKKSYIYFGKMYTPFYLNITVNSKHNRTIRIEDNYTVNHNIMYYNDFVEKFGNIDTMQELCDKLIAKADEAEREMLVNMVTMNNPRPSDFDIELQPIYRGFLVDKFPKRSSCYEQLKFTESFTIDDYYTAIDNALQKLKKAYLVSIGAKIKVHTTLAFNYIVHSKDDIDELSKYCIETVLHECFSDIFYYTHPVTVKDFSEIDIELLKLFMKYILDIADTVDIKLGNPEMKRFMIGLMNDVRKERELHSEQ